MASTYATAAGWSARLKVGAIVSIPGDKSAEFSENISARLPRTDDEAERLKLAIAELLRTIPETWAEFDYDKLTAVQSNALFLLTAAGMVERRGWIRSTIANHPTCFELRFQSTGEAGFVRAMEAASALEYEVWGDAWRKWNSGETRGRCPFHAEGLSPQEWRLTDQGTHALAELNGKNADANPATVFDFVLKRGIHGPGFYYRMMFVRQLSDDEKRTIANALANGADPAQLSRPPVAGEGQLVEYRRIDQPCDAQAVSVANWQEGADALANAFAAKLGPMFERMEAKADSANTERAADELDASKPKPRGRKKADYATQQREAKLAADWKRAYEAGTYKADFAKDNQLTVSQLDALLDRVAKRKRASE